MSDQGKQMMESVSAMVDGEANELEFRRVLKEIVDNDELRHAWQRYHLVSASLKRELPNHMVDLSDSIRAAIDEEPSHAKKFPLHTIVKPLGRFAIAASVAAIAVVGVQQYQQQGQENLVPVAAVDVAAEEDEPFVHRPFPNPQVPFRTVNATKGAATDTSEPRPVIILQKVSPENQLDQRVIQSRLNELMLQHADNAALNTYQGMMPFARIPQAPKE